MRTLISGSSGFIGSALTERLMQRGDHVVRLVRRPLDTGTDADPDAQLTEIAWDPTDPDSIDPSQIGHIDAIFNLSGVSVVKRWNAKHKKLISDSRIQTTSSLVTIATRLETPPKALITAGGMAIYGDRGDEQITEDSPIGEGFLASVAVPWEAAASKITDIGTRSVIARFGSVLSATGGSLPTLIRPFRLGVGGKLGNGRQWSPWIHLEDAVEAMIFAAEQDTIQGPLNVVSPGVVRNAEMARAVGKALGKPVFGWMPAIVARIILGQYIQELGIASVLAIPEKLLNAGFQFKYPDLEACLQHELASLR